MRLMQIGSAKSCSCGRHGWVRLDPVDGAGPIVAQIDAAVAQAIRAELRGEPCAHADAFSLMQSTLAALHTRVQHVSVVAVDTSLSASLHLLAPDGYRVVETEACNALLAACRLQLPILVRDDRHDVEAENEGTTDGAAEIPSVFHELLHSLDLRLDNGRGTEPECGS